MPKPSSIASAVQGGFHGISLSFCREKHFTACQEVRVPYLAAFSDLLSGRRKGYGRCLPGALDTMSHSILLATHGLDGLTLWWV